MNDEQPRKAAEEKFAEFEQFERQEDAKHEQRQRQLRAELGDPRARRGIDALFRERLNEFVGPAAAAIADDLAAGINELRRMLAELELIGPENPGIVRWNVDFDHGVQVAAIEANHPDGARLYSGLDADTIIASRMRPDGRYEHAQLDEHGMPGEWRTAYRPDLN
jgi:hypothetical protein